VQKKKPKKKHLTMSPTDLEGLAQLRKPPPRGKSARSFTAVAEESLRQR
jgi:hypothetical protein